MSRRICSALLTQFLRARVQMAEQVRLFWLVLAPHVTHLLKGVSPVVWICRTAVPTTKSNRVSSLACPMPMPFFRDRFGMPLTDFRSYITIRYTKNRSEDCICISYSRHEASTAAT